MHPLLIRCGGESAFKKILHKFYNSIVSERATMHYFFNVPVEAVVEDQLRLMTYIFPRPNEEYWQPPKQTAISDVNVQLNVFGLVVRALHECLKGAYIETDDIPVLTMHILEVADETRSRYADLKKNVISTVEINPKSILNCFVGKGIMSEIDATTGEIASLHGYGLAYPLFTLVKPVEKVIRLISRADGREGVTIGQVLALIQTLKTKVEGITFSTHMIKKIVQKLDGEDEIDVEIQVPVLQGYYEVSTQFGVPNRLLLRLGNQFTKRFLETLRHDEEDLLINIVKK